MRAIGSKSLLALDSLGSLGSIASIGSIGLVRSIGYIESYRLYSSKGNRFNIG